MASRQILIQNLTANLYNEYYHKGLQKNSLNKLM